MKTSIFAFLTILFVSSCAKDYTCECKQTVSYPGMPSATSTTEVEYEKVTKRWMKNTAACVSSSTSEESMIGYDINGNPIFDDITISSDCEIKN